MGKGLLFKRESSHSPWKSPGAVISHIPTARLLRVIRKTYTDISIRRLERHFYRAPTRKVNPLGCRSRAFELQYQPEWERGCERSRIERDAIHRIKPKGVPRDEIHYTFGRPRIISRFDNLVCHLLPARRTLSKVAR